MNRLTKRAVGVWALILMGAVLVAGCSTPKLSEKGKKVRLLKKVDQSLLDCARYTSFRVKTKAITSRYAQKYRNILARNSPGNAGANAVVPISQPNDKVSSEMGCTGPKNIRVEATASSPGAAQKRKNILARNQAAKEGFNVVVPTSRIFRKGRVQIFEAYQCDKLKKTGKDGQ